MADWKKVLLFSVVGCVSVVVLLVVAGAAALLWATSVADDLGEPTLEPATLGVAIAPEATAGMSTGAVLTDLGSRLEIELQDGQFDIVAGPRGSNVLVEGTYAANYYELVAEHEGTDADGGPVTAVRLRPTNGSLVRMMGSLRGNRQWEAMNRLTVSIPADRPIALALHVSLGQSRIDLGGLALTELDAELRMGNHQLGFGTSLVTQPRQVRLSGEMGNIELRELGNARAGELHASSRMGDFTVDLSGAWRLDEVTDVTLSHSMGDLRLRIPTSVRISTDSHTSSRFGESSEIDRRGETGDANVPVVRLNASTTMGATRISRIEIAAPDERAEQVRGPAIPAPAH
ncbi:MAG: hypothetical protein CL477_19035 [Acidobacteria bacterium]|jgi:hypothetical protein|nr:hypothetical protein [Acidobacteriota bacterium]|tara:strand:- start:2258 stop:3292 length:1035 start_codon:yes stop_codon:yes gene_type:complete